MRPDAKLPAIPSAAVRRAASRPSSRPATSAAANGPQAAVACQPRAWKAPGTAIPSRVIASSPATVAVSTARPSRPPASPTASATGTTTAEAWVMESAWVSSKSRLWASVPLARMASGAAAVRLAPITVQSPAADHPSSAPRTDGALSPVEAASAMPRTSSVRRRALAMTSGGTRSKSSDAANSARRRASVTRPSLPGQRDVAVDLAAAQRDHHAAVRPRGLELLGQAGVEHPLHELLALVARGGQQVRLPAHDEVASAHVRQPRLRPLQLAEPVIEHALRRRTRSLRRDPRDGTRRPGLRAVRRGAPIAREAIHAEGAQPLAELEVAEAAHAQVSRELVRRPR